MKDVFFFLQKAQPSILGELTPHCDQQHPNVNFPALRVLQACRIAPLEADTLSNSQIPPRSVCFSMFDVLFLHFYVTGTAADQNLVEILTLNFTPPAGG